MDPKKVGMGVFSKVVICPPHKWLVYSCMPTMILQCFFCNSKWCLPSFVSPSSCIVLFFQCFLPNITACTAAGIGGRTSERKAPFAKISFKDMGIFLKVGLCSGLRYVSTVLSAWFTKCIRLIYVEESLAISSFS